MSEIITNKLTGKASAGDVTITSEGGAATMQLQQGVAKAWNNVDGTGTIASRDSFNISGITDIGTGQIKHSFVNSMSTADSFVASGWARVSASWGYFVGSTNTPMTASSFEHGTLGTGDSNLDALFATVSIDGDLA